MSVWKIIGSVFILLYPVALLNRILYLRKIYLMDIRNLEQQGRSEVAVMQTKMIREGTIRYARGIADGFINETERIADERVQRRRLEYRHDRIASIITAMTGVLSKRS